ncbi:hypothetical protein HDU93_003152, partial [Gonapodya sp. JEL0774]
MALQTATKHLKKSDSTALRALKSLALARLGKKEEARIEAETILKAGGKTDDDTLHALTLVFRALDD